VVLAYAGHVDVLDVWAVQVRDRDNLVDVGLLEREQLGPRRVVVVLAPDAGRDPGRSSAGVHPELPEVIQLVLCVCVCVCASVSATYAAHVATARTSSDAATLTSSM
jgi:hypothetical protein